MFVYQLTNALGVCISQGPRRGGGHSVQKRVPIDIVLKYFDVKNQTFKPCTIQMLHILMWLLQLPNNHIEVIPAH